MAVIIALPRFRALDANGDPLSGGKVYFYEAGTSTPKDTYTDSGAGTPNANPVVLDSEGYADVWGSGTYKIVVKNSSDVTQFTVDNVEASGSVISDGTVTNAKLADMAANTIKARVGSTSGTPEDVALSASQVIGRDSTGNVDALDVGNGLQAVSGSLRVGGTVAAGLSATSYNAGTFTTGTYTPDPANGNIQHATNNGAHTLAPPATVTVITVEYTNGASAGAITTSGFDIVSGDSFTTTNGHQFICDIRNLNSLSHLHVKAAQ